MFQQLLWVAAMPLESTWRIKFKAGQNSEFCEKNLVVLISIDNFYSNSFKKFVTLRSIFCSEKF